MLKFTYHEYHAYHVYHSEGWPGVCPSVGGVNGPSRVRPDRWPRARCERSEAADWPAGSRRDPLIDGAARLRPGSKRGCRAAGRPAGGEVTVFGPARPQARARCERSEATGRPASSVRELPTDGASRLRPGRESECRATSWPAGGEKTVPGNRGSRCAGLARPRPDGGRMNREAGWPADGGLTVSGDQGSRGAEPVRPCPHGSRRNRVAG
jgi:hypothetical protein